MNVICPKWFQWTKHAISQKKSIACLVLTSFGIKISWNKVHHFASFGDQANFNCTCLLTRRSQHLSWPQPHLKRLCAGGSTPAGKPAVQEIVRQGLHDVQDREWTCLCKPCCRFTQAQNLQLQGAQIPTPSPPLENWHVPAFYLPLAIRFQNSVPTDAPSAGTLPAFRSALKSTVEGLSKSRSRCVIFVLTDF